MKIINLTQNTEEWLKWRRQGVGASDVPALLGISPYKSRKKFLEEWMGFAPVGSKRNSNRDIERGIRLEGLAREELAKKLALSLDPLCAEWDGDNFLRASLDGYNPDNNLIAEIKAPREFKKISLPHYFQMQAQLIVSGAKECVYCQIVERMSGPEILWEVVKPDARAQDQIKESVLQFKNEVQFNESTTDEEKLWLDFINSKESLDSAELRFRMAETNLKASLGMAKEKSYSLDDGRKFVISKTIRRGAIDYKSIPLLNEINLEAYRKEANEVVSIREIRNRENDN